jgi:nicotinamide riboside kinase
MTSQHRSKIAITGGPSGGKTTLIETLKRELGKKVSVAPEAATILYRGGFPRKKSDKAVRRTQIAIYHTQKELEAMVFEESLGEVLVCDRGSLDGIAYWPGDSAEFFYRIDSNKTSELKRYDWVLHLDTADFESYDTENTIRTETHAEASALNERIKNAWAGHPQRFVIPNQSDFLRKMTMCLNIIHLIMAKKGYDEILKQTLVHHE